jgi:hypothetical protein
MPTVKERLDKHDRQLAQHDKQIAAIRGLIKEGMSLVVQTRKDIHKLAVMQLETAAAQKRTDASLRAFIGSLRGGGNGHTKSKL